jgi:DNA-binding MarR family transcriptional regulator
MLPASQLGPCSCSQIRRAARKISSLYDAVLAPSGLTVTQYSLLVNVARAGQVSRTVLADKVGMDRTTLTRNLQPLSAGKLISTAIGEDRREHLIRLSAAGQRKVRQTLPLWEEAQRRFATEMGPGRLRALRTVLTSAEAAVSKASE